MFDTPSQYFFSAKSHCSEKNYDGLAFCRGRRFAFGILFIKTSFGYQWDRRIDIESWFQRKAGHDSAKEKHTKKTLGTYIPEVLRILLIAQGGNIWFDDYKSLSVDVRLSLLICRFVYDEKYCIVAI
ncbi:hypothetical protein Plhal304r1_c026g0087781 [Plasmopara halstedii]